MTLKPKYPMKMMMKKKRNEKERRSLTKPIQMTMHSFDLAANMMPEAIVPSIINGRLSHELRQRNKTG